MQLNLTLNHTLNLRWNLDVNVDLSMLRLSRCPGFSTVLRALFRDDQVVIRPTMITLLLILLSLLSSSFSLFGLKRPFQTILFFSYHK